MSSRADDLIDRLNEHLALSGSERSIPKAVVGREGQRAVRDALAEVIADLRVIAQGAGIPYNEVDHIAHVQFLQATSPEVFEN